MARRPEPLLPVISVLTLVVAGLACRGSAVPRQEDLRLLGPTRLAGGHIEVVSEGRPATQGPADVEQREIAGSFRRALVSNATREWRLGSPIGTRARLAFWVGAPGDDAGECRAQLEIRDDGTGGLLLEQELTVAVGEWNRHVLSVPATRSATIHLRSDEEVAWAELVLLGTEETRVRGLLKPNVLVVIADTLRADHLSLSGYERETSPHLDILAEKSLVFDRAYSASTWTLPSTASLLTGLLPSQHGALGLAKKLPAEARTLAELASDAGYHTVALTDGGFLNPKWGLAQGFDRYDVTPGEAWAPKDVARSVESARSWLASNEIEPFLLLLHSYETHQPFTNDEGFADAFLTSGSRLKRASASEERATNYAESWDPSPEEKMELEAVEALYDGEIRRLDHYLGELWSWLDETGFHDHGALLFTSDHGEELMDHGNMDHGLGKVFDANVRVPLLVRLPGQEEGRRITTRVSGVDVLPTLLEIMGLDAPEGLLGDSVLTGLREERPLFVEGSNSFPGLRERRIRMETPEGRSIVHDLQRLRTVELGSVAGPGKMGSDGPLSVDELPLLAAVLAWQGRGQLVVRLPEGTEWLAVPRSSRLQPRELRVGLSRREVFRGGRFARGIEIDPFETAYLSFDIAGRGDWDLRIRSIDGVIEPVRIATRSRAGEPYVWKPTSGELPDELVAFRTAEAAPAAEAVFGEKEKDELEALGYL